MEIIEESKYIKPAGREKIYKWFLRLTQRLSERQMLAILAVVVGALAGLGTYLFEVLLHGIKSCLVNWFDVDTFHVLYLIYPGIGMLLAMLFVRFVVKDNIGHGVTKVLVAVSKNESKIKGHNMWTSLVASSVTIGFGGSVGAEAPIVYTGAAIGSNVARYMGLSYKNMTILLGCGAAGAVAGIFNAPLAGVLFTLEILLFNISMTSILPLLLSTISATVISYIFFGDQPAYIYEEMDGSFPNHEPNPLVQKNVEDLKKLVLQTKADIGVIFDGDADRVMFVDENGRFISPDLMIAVLGHYFLEERGEKGYIHQDIRSSKAVGEYLAPMGGVMNTWRVGRAYAALKLRELDGVFGGDLLRKHNAVISYRLKKIRLFPTK